MRRGESHQRSTIVKRPSADRDDHTKYISEISNIHSLLNIRPQPRHTRRSFEDRVLINVCGDRYETHRTTLELYPKTLLGDRQRRKYYYDRRRKEYFFDRHRACFEAILYFYQSNGRLRRPNYVPLDIFLEEVTFFELGAEALKQLRTDENLKEVKKVPLPKNRFRRHLWATMEYPDYSIVAKLVNIFSLLLILLSTISLAVESLPTYVELADLGCEQAVDDATNNTSGTDHRYVCHLYFTSPFFIIQAVCIAFFTIELFLRMISTPSIVQFIKNLMNWIDVLAVIPFYVVLSIRLRGGDRQINTGTYIALRLLRILRFLRIFKLYQVFKGIKSLRVLASTVKQSVPDFFIMILILTLLSFLFGAAAFLAENDTNGQGFDSIFKATYWGVITITSVGYGDISPITPMGRVISCLCALCGAATIAVLVSVLVDRYQRVYARKLYIQEEIIDFQDYSDDENNDDESKCSTQCHRRRASARIEDPDRRAKDKIEPLPIDEDNCLGQRTHSGLHFVIGYVGDERQNISEDFLQRISTLVAEESERLSVQSNEEPPPSLHHVEFTLSSSSSSSDNELADPACDRADKKHIDVRSQNK